MYLMYYTDALGSRVYTLKVRRAAGCTELAQKVSPSGEGTKSAHPARFSPDDKFSRHRVTLKRRFGILPTQLPSKPY